LSQKSITLQVLGDEINASQVRINQMTQLKTYPRTRMVSLSAAMFAEFLFPERSFRTPKARKQRDHYITKLRDGLAPHLKPNRWQ